MGDNKRPDLRRWLEMMVRKQKCPGLEWENQEEMLFRLPWPHQKSRDWRPEDCQIYIEWAKHTGRYKEGDPMDFPTWKTRIRTAINKNREIEEVTNMHKRDSTSPYKVYRFLPTSPSRSRKDHERSSPTSTVSDDTLRPNSVQDNSQFLQFEAPLVFSHLGHHCGGAVKAIDHIGSSLNHALPTVVSEFDSMDTSENYYMAETMDTTQDQMSRLSVGYHNSVFQHGHHGNVPEVKFVALSENNIYYPDVTHARGSDELSSDLISLTSGDLMHVSKAENFSECMSENVSQTPTEDTSVKQVCPNEFLFHVQVLYGIPGKVVNSSMVRTNRCRLFFGSPNSGTTRADGEQQRTEIQMPNFEELEGLSDKDKVMINKALFEVEGGEVILTYKDDDIFAERRCLTKIFVSDGVSESDVLPRSKKNRPPVETKIFDFREKFMPELSEHQSDPSKPVPKDFCYLTFGYEILKNDDSPLRVVPVYVVIKHYKAVLLRHQTVQNLESKPLISADSDSFGSNRTT